jgi:hypothetical protein
MERYTREQVAELVGREVMDLNGASVGYVDLVFVDHDTGRPEWIGAWSGVPGGPRVLVPLRGVEVSGSEVRVPGRRASSVRLPATSRRTTGGS